VNLKGEQKPLPTLEGSYWLSRIVFLRSLAGIYLVAFLVAFLQNEALIGIKGLTPYDMYLESLEKDPRNGLDWWSRFLKHPTLFWLIPMSEHPFADLYLTACAVTGASVSALILVTGSANIPLLTTLWLLYLSLVNVGQTWYSFGWESQLLEIGFLAIWAV
jgi:hypothetical protein